MPATQSQSSPQRRIYRIRIEGSLDPSWSDRLGGLSITATGQAGRKTTTTLEGEMCDQGALIGVLNTLYELHLLLEAVETVETVPSDTTESSPAMNATQ